MRLAHWQLAAAMAMVGANIAVAKAAIPFIPIFIFSLLRYGVALVVLLPFALNEPGQRFRDLSLRGWSDLFLQALTGGLLYMVLMLYGLHYTSAVSAGIITSTVPAVVAILAVLLLRERLTYRGVAALALAVLGIFAVNTAAARAEVAPWPLLGNMFMAGAVLAEGLFVIVTKRSTTVLAPYRMALAFNIIGLVFIAPLAAFSLAEFSFSSVPWQIWLLPIFYSLTSSALALILWYRGLASVPASEAAIFTSTFPISAVAVSIVFLGENLLWAHSVGLVCVLAAIYIGANGKRR